MNDNKITPCALKQPAAIIDKADRLGRSIYGYHAPKGVFGDLATSTVCVFAYSANFAPEVCSALDHYLVAFDRRKGLYLVFETYEKLATYEKRISAIDCQDCVYATLDPSDVKDIYEKFQSTTAQRDFFSGSPIAVVCVQNVRRNNNVGIAGARTRDEHSALLALLERKDMAQNEESQRTIERENKRSAAESIADEEIGKGAQGKEDDQDVCDRWSRSFQDDESSDTDAIDEEHLDKRRRTKEKPKRSGFLEKLEAQKANVLARDANENAPDEKTDIVAESVPEDALSNTPTPIVDGDQEVLFSRVSLYIVEDRIIKEWIGSSRVDKEDTGVSCFDTMMKKLSDYSFAVPAKANSKAEPNMDASTQNRRVFSSLVAAQKLHDDRHNVPLAPPLIEEEPLFPVLTAAHNVRFLLYDYQRRMINWLLKREMQTLMYEAYPLANVSPNQIGAGVTVDDVCVPQAIIVQNNPSLVDVDLFRYTLSPSRGHLFSVAKADAPLESKFLQAVYPRIVSGQALHNTAVREMLSGALFGYRGEPNSIGARLRNIVDTVPADVDRIVSRNLPTEAYKCEAQDANVAALCAGECRSVPLFQSASPDDLDPRVASCAPHLQLEAMSRSVRTFDYHSRHPVDVRAARNPELFRAAVSCGKTGCGKTTMIILMQWVAKRWEDSFGENVRIERNPEQTTAFEAMLPTQRRTLSLPPHMRNPQQNADDALCHVRAGRYYANCTLVVCPEQVVEQWFSEYEKTIGCGTARKRPKTGPNRSITNGGVYGEIVDENDNLLLQIAVVRDIRALRQLTISEIIQHIDVLIVNVNLFNSNRYREAYGTFSARYKTAVGKYPPHALMRGVNGSNARLFYCSERDQWVKEAVSIERQLIRQQEKKLAEAFMNETVSPMVPDAEPKLAASASSTKINKKRTRSEKDDSGSANEAPLAREIADDDEDIEVTLSGKDSRNLRAAAEKRSITEPGELFGMPLLHAICFRRLVVDEAHLLSTRARVLERGVCSLVADFKHCVTATANFGVPDAFFRSNTGGNSGYGPMLSIGGSATSRLVQAWWDYRRQFVERCSGTTSDAALPEVRMHRVPVAFTQAETAIYSSMRVGVQTQMQRLLFCSHHMLNDDNWVQKNIATALGTQGSGASNSSRGGEKVSDKLMSIEEVANAMQEKRMKTLRQHNRQLLERIKFFRSAWKDIADAAPEQLVLEATSYVDSGGYFAQNDEDESLAADQAVAEGESAVDDAKVVADDAAKEESDRRTEQLALFSADSMCQIEAATLDAWMQERSIRIAQHAARLDKDLSSSARTLRTRYTVYCKDRNLLIGQRQRVLSEILFYQNVMHRLQNPDEEIECPICMCEDNTRDSVMLTACGHEFCPPCAKQYFARNAMCPMRCRRLQLPRDLRLVDRRGTVTETPKDKTVSGAANSKDGGDEKSFVRDRYGSKIDALLLLLSQITGRADCKKIVIFAQFQRLLVLIADVLREQGVNFVVARGSIRSCERAFHAFRNDPAVRIILLSSDKSISGVQLVEANHLIAVHPTLCSRGVDEEVATFWQAVGRIRRLMQRETCHVWQMITRGTFEEELYIAQTALAQKRLAADPGVLWNVPNTCEEEAAWDAARKASEPKPCDEQEDASESQGAKSKRPAGNGGDKKKRKKDVKLPDSFKVIDLEANNDDDDDDEASSTAKQKAN